MSVFVLRLLDAAHTEQFSEVSAFVGEDASGRFGLQANHARFMTALVFDLAKFRQGNEAWRYLALPGGILLFKDNILTISTRHFMVDTDFERISVSVVQQLRVEEENLRATKHSLHTMEQAMFKRMLALQRKTGWSL